MSQLATEIRALFVPAFQLTDHLARSAEVRTFDLLGHVRKRQTINVLSSTCKKLRRPL
jgi:hypothetical protein